MPLPKILTPLQLKLADHNKRVFARHFEESVENAAEVFFSVSVCVESLDVNLHWENAGGLDRVIDTMERMLPGLKKELAKRNTSSLIKNIGGNA